MDYEVFFYAIGIGLAVAAVLVSFVGLRVERFPGRAGAIVFVCFAAMAGGATTFAVLHSQHEEEHREQEAGLPQATEEAEREEAQ